VCSSLLHFSDMNIADFWKWTDFSSYVQFMALFTLMASAITYKFIENAFYVELLGFLALMTEAMLGLPQFYRNYRNQSTEGMRLTVFMNVMCLCLSEVTCSKIDMKVGSECSLSPFFQYLNLTMRTEDTNMPVLKFEKDTYLHSTVLQCRSV